jgi:glycosyltransferase involved in cell wall biosynthesis
MILGIDASRALRPAGQQTGTERYSFHLIEAMLRLAPTLPAPPSVRLYSDVAPAQAIQQAWPNANWRVMPSPRLWTHARLSLEMAQRPPAALFVPAHVLPLWRPRRTLVTIHDLGYLFFPQAHPPRQRWYLDWSTRWNGRVATRVLADSQATAADLRQHLGVPSHRITVVYPGFIPTRQRVMDSDRVQATLARYGVRPPYFLYVGTLQPRKNLVRLAQALARVLARASAERPDAAPPILVLAGKPGWLSDQVLPPIAALGLGDRVRTLGYVPEADLPALLTGAAALAFPSLHEGFGFPILEAQACGAPVLTSTTSSCPEVAGEGALLVDPHDVDAIAGGLWRLLTEPALAQRLTEQGAANVRRFRWESAARQVFAVLEQMGVKGERSPQ